VTTERVERVLAAWAAPVHPLTRGAAIAAVVAAGATIGVATAVSPILALGAVAGLMFVAATLVDITVGLAVFTVISFFSAVTGGSDLTVVKLAGVVLAGVALLRVIQARGAEGNLFRDHVLLASAATSLGLWAFASEAWASSPETARSNAFRLAQGIVLLFVVYATVRSVRHLRAILWAFVVGATLTAVYGFAVGATNAHAVGRLSGGIGDPNELAAALVPAVAISGFLYLTSPTVRERVAVAACMALVYPTLFLTQSRGGLVAAAVMLAAALAIGGRFRPHALALALVLAAVGIAYFTMFASPAALSRISTAGSGTGRLDLWNVALRMFENHPLAGVGMGNFPVAAPAYTTTTINLPRYDLILFTPLPTHNTYLQVLAELGVVGFSALMLLMLTGLAIGVRSIRQFDGLSVEGELLARAVVIAALGVFAAFFFFSAQFEKQLWLMLGLLAALPSLSVGRTRGLHRRS
jgi:O-antigen ligase